MIAPSLVRLSGVIFYVSHTCLPRAVSAAKKPAVSLNPMSNDFAAAMIADRCQLLDRAFEAIKSVMIACCNNFER
jgi:hypothetical protein